MARKKTSKSPPKKSADEISLDIATGYDEQPIVTWGDDHYALVPLGSKGVAIDLGEPRTHVSRASLLEKKDVILLAERSGGTKTFIRWLLKDIERPAFLINGDDWSHEHSQAENENHLADELFQVENRELLAEESLAAALSGLYNFGTAETSTEKMEAMKRWARGLPQPVQVVIRDLTAAAQSEFRPDGGRHGNAEQMAVALRKLRDRNFCPNLHILVASSSESIFMDHKDFSGYRSLCDEYQLPGLNESEIRLLAANNLDDIQIEFENACLQDLIQKTGGQPILVQHILRRLRTIAERHGRKTIQQLDLARAYQQMRDSPPSAVSLWEESLRSLLDDRRELVSVLQNYVHGNTIGRAKFPPPAQQRALFVAGWIGLNRRDRWGIRSDFHAHLARSVLDSLEEV